MKRNKFEPFTQENGKGKVSRIIKCSHGQYNDKYKISYGDEIWENGLEKVIKIQITNDHGIQGRKVPSFPLKDIDKVIEALQEIKDEAEAFERKK